MKLTDTDDGGESTPRSCDLSWSLVVCLVVALSSFFFGGSKLEAQYLYTESFKNGTAAGWQFGGTTTPTLTSGGVDPAGDGWLRLTPNTNNQSNFAFFTAPIPAAGNRVEMTFDFVMWNGTGADGISFNLSDAASTYSAGAFGGSMGYAQKTGIDGMAGGFVGVAIDGFGNYANPTEGRIGGPGVVDNSIGLRGPGSGTSGYEYLGGTGNLGAGSVEFYSSTTRPSQTGADYRQLKVLLDENGVMTVSMQQGFTGVMTDLYSIDLSGYARPDEFTLSFTAATGGSTGIHEIRNLTIKSDSALGGVEWDREAGTNNWGTGTNWYSRVAVNNNTVPASGSSIVFGDRPAGTSPMTVDTQSDRTVGAILFNSTEHDYTIQNNTITMDSGGDVASINLTGTKNVVIDSALSTVDATTINHNGTGTLTVNGTINNQGKLLTSQGTGSTTLVGVISGTGGLFKDGSGTTTLTANNTFTGPTTVEQGTMTISGINGDIAQSSSVTIGGCATLILDNSAANNTDRIGSVTMNMDGGTFQFIPRTGANNSSETIGQLNIRESDNTITTGAADAGQSSIVTFSSLARSAGATLNFVNNSEFGAADTNERNTVTFTTAPTLTTNIVTVGGMAFATVDNDWATYAEGEIKAFSAYTDADQGSWSGTSNVLPSVNRALTNNRDVNTLNLQSDSNLTISQASGTRRLTIDTGGLLSSGTGDHLISTSTLRGANNGELIIHRQTVAGSLTISSSIVNNGTTGLTKSGDGTLILSGTSANTYTGNTSVNQGTLTLSKTAGTNAIAGGNITVHCGGTLLLGASNQIVNTSNMTLNGGTFSTAGFDETLGTLTLTENSTLDLGGGDSVINFAASNGTSWDDNSTLTITNWSGYVGGGGTDQVIFGTGPTGLTSTQLAQISFVNPLGIPGSYRAQILASGEIVPFVPESTTVLASLLLLGLACARRTPRTLCSL